MTKPGIRISKRLAARERKLGAEASSFMERASGPRTRPCRAPPVYHRFVQSSCDERHHVWPLFLRAHAVLVETLDAELQATHGLPLSWFDVLVHLAGAPRGRMRMNELGEAVLLSRSGTTRLVDRMESAGLLTRSVSAVDRRVVFATLTARGRAAYASAAPLAVRGVEEHFSRYLTRAEEKALATALSKVIAAVERKGKRRAG